MKLIVFFLTAAGLIAASPAQPASTGSGQTYPMKPVRFIVPYPPGGTADLVARLVSDKMVKSFGQPVVIDNRSGAGRLIGTEALVRAAPDISKLFESGTQ